jgi:hypothetical protein
MNISAWNVAAAGLLEVAVLESYQRADTIADQLCSTEPTKLRKNKFIGHTIIGNMAEGMNPGQRHPRAQFEERYVETPLTKKYGLAIEIMHEAVFFDLTSGGVISRAEDVGNELALLKERQIIDQFIGFNDTLNLNQYSYRGTAYDTYQGSSPWINTQANPLNDFDDVDDSEQLFVGMTDQEKGEPITITAKDILVMPAKYLRAKAILGFDTVQLNTQTDTVRGMGKNPLAGAGYNLIRANARLFNRIAAADGLNIGAANAADYWFHGDFKGAFAWMENWGITTKRAAANDYQMADQDLVLAIFTNYMGTIATKEPRKIVRNTN